jgi:hypothetical protein
MEGLIIAQERAYKLTDAQFKALDDAEAIMTRAFDEARAKISAAGVPGEGSTRCLVGPPHCDAFVQPTGGSGADRLKCKRQGCGHFFTRHDVF